MHRSLVGPRIGSNTSHRFDPQSAAHGNSTVGEAEACPATSAAEPDQGPSFRPMSGTVGGGDYYASPGGGLAGGISLGSRSLGVAADFRSLHCGPDLRCAGRTVGSGRQLRDRRAALTAACRYHFRQFVCGQTGGAGLLLGQVGLTSFT